MDEQHCKEQVRSMAGVKARPTLARVSAIKVVVTAMLAAAIAIGLVTGVAILFQRDGLPMAHLIAAERACSPHAYVSDRESCVREWLAVSHSSHSARVR